MVTHAITCAQGYVLDAYRYDRIFHTCIETFYLKMGVQRVTDDETRNDDVMEDSDWVSALVSSLIVSALGILRSIALWRWRGMRSNLTSSV